MSTTCLWRAALDDHIAVLAWSPDGGALLAGSLGGDAVILAGATGETEAKLAHHPLGVLSGSWHPSVGTVATGGQDGVVRLVAGDGREIAAVDVGGWVNALAWSPDGGLLAVGGGRRFHLLASDGRPRRAPVGQPSTITAVAWSVDGRRAAAAAYGGVAWFEPSADDAGPVRRFDWKGSLLSLAVSPTGRWLCAGSQDATVHLWRLWSGEDLSMSGYPAKIQHAAFRSDGRWMANACLGEVTIWDFFGKGPRGGRPAQAEAHDRHVTALGWQPGGDLLATGGADGSLALWPSPKRQGQQLRPVHGDDGDATDVASLAWSPDGHRLAVGRADGTVELRALA